MGELQKETFQIRVENEYQVNELIAKHQEETKGLVTYSTRYRERKEKKEVVETWYVVTITHDYTKN